MAIIKPSTESMVKGKSASGSPSFNNGDVVAEGLQGQPIEVAYAVATEFGLDVEGKYDHLNPGHQRMVLGSRIRKAIKDQNKARNLDAEANNGMSSMPFGEDLFNAYAAKHRVDPEAVAEAA
jgi:colicin import membrane protein